ncbi:MAG: hypothetical protein AAB873_01845 [Patescibacteria group bacterium]
MKKEILFMLILGGIAVIAAMPPSGFYSCLPISCLIFFLPVAGQKKKGEEGKKRKKANAKKNKSCFDGEEKKADADFRSAASCFGKQANKKGKAQGEGAFPCTIALIYSRNISGGNVTAGCFLGYLFKTHLA